MSELNPGHPDELRAMLSNFLARAHDPIGTLRTGITAEEWAVKQFIDAWRGPVRAAIDSIEESLRKALAALAAGDAKTAEFEISDSLQSLGEDLRSELGLFAWNRESD
jgi:hypothetical protein